MIELEVRCTRCLRRFIPTHRDYVAGEWRTCHRCRGHPPDTNTETDTKARSDDPTASQGPIRETGKEETP